MKLHTDTLTSSDLHLAARVARVDFDRFEQVGSRSRSHGFDFTLRGESRRRPNFGTSTRSDRFDVSEHAATWDQWGVFLAVLFDLDPHAFAGSVKRPTYADRSDFHSKTFDRFVPGGILPGRPTREQVETPGHAWSGAFRVPQYASDLYANDATGHVYRVAGSYWPADAHGDHRFEFAGVPYQQSCRKCSARFSRA